MNRNSFLASSVAAGMVTTFPKIALAKQKIPYPFAKFYNHIKHTNINRNTTRWITWDEHDTPYNLSFGKGLILGPDAWKELYDTYWEGKTFYEIAIIDNKNWSLDAKMPSKKFLRFGVSCYYTNLFYCTKESRDTWQQNYAKLYPNDSSFDVSAYGESIHQYPQKVLSEIKSWGLEIT